MEQQFVGITQPRPDIYNNESLIKRADWNSVILHSLSLAQVKWDLSLCIAADTSTVNPWLL